MTDTLRDRIAVVLESEGLTQLGALSVANVVMDEILAIPGIAVVELPEPDPVPTDEDDGKPPLARWGAESGADFQTSVWHFGEVQIDQYARGGWWEALEPISAANARRFAAALLAAAEKAEEK